MGTTTRRTSEPKTLEIPPISSLQISRLPRREPNPDGLAVYRRVYKEASEMDLLIDPQHYLEHVTMSAYLWPYAPVERLTALAYFNTIGYYLNDTISRDIKIMPNNEAARLRVTVAQTAEQVLLRGADADPADKYGQAFIKLREMLGELTNPDFVSRFFPALMVHWRDVTVSYNKRGFDDVGVQEFIALRRSTSGMLPIVMLTELAQDVYMPQGALERVPSLETAIIALADIGGLSNELFSYTKEVIIQESRFNLIPVIEREYGYTDTLNAIFDAMAIVDNCFETFEKATEAMQAEASQIEDADARDEVENFLASFLPGMWDVAAACYHWQMETNRYRCEQNPFPDLKSQIPYDGLLPASQRP